MKHVTEANAAQKLRHLRRTSLEELRKTDAGLARDLESVLRAYDAKKSIASAQLPEEIRVELEAIDFGNPHNDVFEKIKIALKGHGADDETANAAAQTAKTGTASPPFQLGANPAVVQKMVKSQVNDVATASGVSSTTKKTLATAIAAPSEITDDALAQFVANGALTADEASAIGLTASLYQITGENAELASAIRTNSFASAGGKPPSSLLDLIAVTADEWAAFFSAHPALVPSGASAAQMAATLASRFAAAFPGPSLFARLPTIDTAQVQSDLATLAPLAGSKGTLVGVPLTSLNTNNASDAQLATYVEAHERLSTVANQYAGLGAAAILNDPTTPASDKAATIGRLAGYLKAVGANLGQTDLLQLNLATDSTDVRLLGLSTLGASAADQAAVFATVRGYQRALIVAGNTDDALTLIQHGFTSATSIGKMSLDAFSTQSGLLADTAQAVWERGRTALADMSLSVGSLVDHFHLPLGGVFGNIGPSVDDYLKQLAGFQDLFGNLSLCSCQECQSILGPAAYFVDLMKFIDDNLRTQFPSPGLPLDLKTRRPDLWTLVLSCDNTNNRIALLDVVNPVLENYIAQRLEYTGPLTDRAAIEKLVYENTLATKVDSITQPFVLPLARIASYLSSFPVTRAQIATALGTDKATFAQAELGLSSSDVTLISVANANLSNLSHVYGIAFSGSVSAVGNVDASVMDAAMDLSRTSFGALVATAFVAAGGASVKIVATKRSSDSVQNDVEWVEGLTADALDRMYRLTHLSQKTGISISDLDLMLTSIGDTALGTAAIESIARIHALIARFQIDAQVAAALVGPLPQQPAGTSLFDSLFNTPSYVATDGTFPQPATHFVHPAFRQNTSAPIDPNLPRLLSALSIDLDDLAALVRALASHLAQETTPGFDPNAANEDDRYFVLSAANLSLLYRHAKLAQLLGLSISALFQLLGFTQLDRVASLADLQTILDVFDWYQGATYTLDQIAVATGGTPLVGASFEQPATLAAQIVSAAATALSFSDTVFSIALGTTETGSKDLIASNPTVIEAGPNSTWRLVAGIDLGTIPIVIPASATVPTPPSGTRPLTDTEVRAALQPYVASQILTRGVGSAFGFATDKVQALAALAGVSLTANAIVTAVRGDGPIAPLVTLVATLLPLSVIFADPAWDATAIAFAGANPAIFGPGPLPATVPDAQHPNAPFVTLSQLRAIATYTRIAERLLASSTPGGATAADLQSVLQAFDSGIPGFPAATDATMARVLGVAQGLVVGLRGLVVLPATAAPALDRLDVATQTAVSLGVDGQTFAALVTNDYEALSHAADALIAVLRTTISDQTALATKLDEIEQPVRAAKRDALADYLIHSITPQIWTTQQQLYEYFLIDVQAGGCETTSLVVAATMSAQLYVYRALMNLEQDNLPPTDPSHFVLTVPAEAAAEWEWRKNYRVWQANREVFLWPENYMIPDLRDDKTPLFEQIEQELLQTDLTDQNVFDAYTKYLSGLQEVSSLTIAGAYHEMTAPYQKSAAGGVNDVLHLFGCTADDPPTYYYRTCQNLITSRRDVATGPLWSAWQKVSVQITSRRVAPVVFYGRLFVFWSDVKTKSKNAVTGGASKFTGYQHQMTLKFTSLRTDGTWTALQQLRLPPGAAPGLLSDPFTSMFGPARGQVTDPLLTIPMVGTLFAQYDLQKRTESDPIDDYTLSGPNWEGIWPTPWTNGSDRGLEIMYRNFIERRQVDLFSKTTYDLSEPWQTDAQKPYPQILCAKNGGDTKPLYCGTPAWMPYPETPTANLMIDEKRMDIIEMDTGGPGTYKPYLTPGLYAAQIATIPAQTELLAVPGSVEDGILQVGNDVLLLMGSRNASGGYVLTRIGTTIVDDIARRLFEDGVDAVLDIQTQYQLAEAGLPITLVGSKIADESNKGTLDFKGAYGTYYRELFFYLPWLIANALNGRGNYASSATWYEYIFDPTSNDKIDVTGVAPADVAHRLLDRVWKYREFRGLDIESLRALLTDPATIALYKQDPFNPWAIARKRISAFQKAMVMAYVGNLLDWGDSLFTQFTMESVNEAMMLYIMASDILGPRPVELGDCGQGVTPENYATIGPLIDSSGEILIELETWTFGYRISAIRALPVAAKYMVNQQLVTQAVAQHPLAALDAAPEPPVVATTTATSTATTTAMGTATTARGNGAATLSNVTQVATAESDTSLFTGYGWKDARVAAWAPALSGATTKTRDPIGGRLINSGADKWKFPGWGGGFGWGILRQIVPVFCVPANDTLLGLWDRVDDRLYKIRHCQDINGNLAQLALFAPPINPLQLVELQAAGLSLDDVLASSNGNLPPYRFAFLIERAKSYAATLSGFGASMLSALEKKDGEQLNNLRLTQQMNLLQMTTTIRQSEVDSAQATLDSLTDQYDAATYRSQYYAGLISGGRSAWEDTQTAALHTSSAMKATWGALENVAATLRLLPQIGSPFSMKYGGVEVGSSLTRFAAGMGALAAVSEAVASSAGLEANFERRNDGWQNLKTLADYDVAALNDKIKAAKLQLEIQKSALKSHLKTIDQVQKLIDFSNDKFTNFGLYTWLSAQLKTMYRGAYQSALAFAMLAQQAYRFERGDDTLPGLSLNYWDPTNSGLLAGEQLLMDLQSLEQRFLETNYRTLELDQPFALSQIDPQALVDLRETGQCTFTIGEAFFDLYYPGHYKRRINAARLTIPCITGPYVNVSATLTLTDSWIRPTPDPTKALVEVPPSRSVSVATSTAQNDAGVFELSFHDERYMPFEGLGAISQWKLSLPTALPAFDYQTINDVIVSLSYNAEYDDALRATVDSANKTVVGGVLRYFSNNTTKRVLSLRQDFSNAFTRLLRSPGSTTVTLSISDRNFPFFLQGRALSVQSATLLLRTAPGASTSGFALTVDGSALAAAAPDVNYGNMAASPLPPSFTGALYGDHTFTITNAGSLAPTSPPPGDTSAVDAAKLLDIALAIEYRLQ